jgi:rare lipoprotein A
MLKKVLFAACIIAAGTTAAEAAWTGKASYYGGRGRTASGGHVGHLTAAHRSLPFGTQLRVTNLHNSRSVVVTVNDRGPFVRGRIVDVSTGAAGVLGMKGAGVAPVRVELVSR